MWVRNIDLVFEAHIKRGVRIGEEISDRAWDARQYVIEDPNGYHLKIAEPIDDIRAPVSGGLTRQRRPQVLPRRAVFDLFGPWAVKPFMARAGLAARCWNLRLNRLEPPSRGPVCQQPTELGPPTPVNADDEVYISPGLTVEEVEAAFTGEMRKPRAPFTYQIALLAVAVAMVLLPIIYVALIGLASWATYYWGTHFTFLLTAVRGGGFHGLMFKLFLYFAPLFSGIVLVLFMVKPLFAPAPKSAQPLALNPEFEPVLFAFIRRICPRRRRPHAHARRCGLPVERLRGISTGRVQLSRQRSGFNPRPPSGCGVQRESTRRSHRP